MDSSPELSMTNLPPAPPRRTSRIAPLPPNVAHARKARVNGDILSFFQSSARPNSTMPISAKGTGLYTHVEISATPPQHLFPHQRFASPGTNLEFLPLGGPRKYQRKGDIKSELPDEVKKVYEELRRVLQEEENLVHSGREQDPRERFGELELPSIMRLPEASIAVPPSPPPLKRDVLAARRNSLIQSIPPSLLSDNQKISLKRALEKSGWPEKFTSMEAFNAPRAAHVAEWSDKDARALLCIYQTSGLPLDVIASTFFPGRSAKSVKDQYTKTSSQEGQTRQLGLHDHGAEARQKIIADIAARRPSAGATKGLSSTGTGVDMTLGGTGGTVVKNTATASATAVATPAGSTGGTTYDPSRDPRRRGR